MENKLPEAAIAFFKTPHKRFEIAIEVAETPEQIAWGLSHRYALWNNVGMYFKFDQPTNRSFWMHDTFVPLSIAFLDSNNRIIDIQDMEPQSLDPHSPGVNYSAAFEIEQGWFQNKNVNVGDYIELLDKNHPLTLNEKVIYQDGSAEVKHDGLHIVGKNNTVVPWSEVDYDSLLFYYPRVLHSNKPTERNFSGFKSVSYVQINPSFIVTGAGAKPTKKPTKKPTTPKPAEPESSESKSTKPQKVKIKASPGAITRSDVKVPPPPDGWPSEEHHWAKIFTDAHTELGVDLTKYSKKTTEWIRQALGGEKAEGVKELTEDQQKRARSFVHTTFQIPIRALTEGMGYPRHQAVTATGILSINHRWDAGNGPHTGNAVAALHHGAWMRDLYGPEGLEIQPHHIERIKRNADEVNRALASRGIAERVQIPEKAGPTYGDEINDATLAAMSPHALYAADRYNSFRVLRSARHPGAKLLTLDDVLQTRVESGTPFTGSRSAPKVSAFISNGEFPGTSSMSVHDQIMKRLLGQAAHGKETADKEGFQILPEEYTPSLDELTDFDTRSDGVRGKPRAGAKRQFGNGAGALAVDLTFRQSVKDSGGPFDVPHEAQNLLWPLIKMNPESIPPLRTSSDRKESISSAAGYKKIVSDTKAALDADENEIWGTHVGHEASPDCEYIHPLIEQAEELARKAPRVKTNSGLIIPYLDPSKLGGYTRIDGTPADPTSSIVEHKWQTEQKQEYDRKREEQAAGTS